MSRSLVALVLLVRALLSIRDFDQHPYVGYLGLYRTFDECEWARVEDMQRWKLPVTNAEIRRGRTVPAWG